MTKHYRRAPRPEDVAEPYHPPRHNFWTRLVYQLWSVLRQRHGKWLATIVLAIGLCACLILISGVLYFALLHTPQPDGDTIPVTATPSITIGPITQAIYYSRLYAFPLAADPAWFVWSHQLPDDNQATRFDARLGFTRAEFEQATHARLVAFTDGTIHSIIGLGGSLGIRLDGDDGYDYVYAAVSEHFVPDGMRVAAGDLIGVMGSTAAIAPYTEPFLHFAVTTRGTAWETQPDVNAAEWIATVFNLRWTERPLASVEPSWPSGWPVQHPRFVVATHFHQAVAHGLPEPALRFGFAGDTPAEAQPVFATLAGIVDLNRWTPAYGSRIQITNEATGMTAIISGLDTWAVTDGQVVAKNQVIGQWNPVNYPYLHYVIFQNGANIDPELTLR